MKKWITFVLSALFLLGLLTTTVFAEEISSVAAEIDSNKLVTVRGVISSGAGKAVNIKIMDPEGRLEYADSIVSSAFGSFQVSYTMANNTAGKYEVLVNALGASSAAASFTYGSDNTLKGLSISRGGFDKAFSPETTEYAVNVDNRVDSITVTPTVSDNTASVTVNGIAAASGTPSGQILLNEGANIIKVAVSALSGQTNTYTVTVTRGSGLAASLTAEASIDADKNVTVSGTISSGAGQMVNLKITDPSGSLEYADSTVSTADGGFYFSYKLANTANGRYMAALGALGVSTPVTAYFDYLEMRSIVISGITLKPNFQNDITFYSAAAGDEVGSVTVTPTASDSKAAITVNSVSVVSGQASVPITLAAGANTIPVILYGREGESCKTYTIIIAKDMGDTEDGTVSAGINKDKLVTVNGTIGSDQKRQVTILVKDPNGNVDYLNTSETAAGGNYQFSYTMTNETKGVYNVLVGAKGLLAPLSTYFLYSPNNPDLNGLELSACPLTPEFARDKTVYSANVSYETGSVTVRPYAVDPLAAIKVNGAAVKSGEFSGAINLSEGQNTIGIVVTVPDGQEKTYTINVTRAYRPLPPPPDPPSGNANLSSLTVSDGNLDPAFSAAVTSYTLAVGNSVSCLTVTPQVQESHAAVKVNNNPVRSGSASDPINLDVGANTINVVVTAENGTTKTYTVTVNREAVLYNVTVDDSLSNGTILTDAATAAAGTTVNLTITPDAGWQLKAGTLKYNDGTDHTIEGISFTMPEADVTVTAQFERVYTVTVDDTITGGTIQADPATAAAGTVVNLTVTPAGGCRFVPGTLKYSYGGDTYDVSEVGGLLKFQMPDADVTVTAEFEEVPTLDSLTIVIRLDGQIDGTPLILLQEPDGEVAGFDPDIIRYSSEISKTGGFSTPFATVTATASDPEATVAIKAEIMQTEHDLVNGTEKRLDGGAPFVRHNPIYFYIKVTASDGVTWEEYVVYLDYISLSIAED